MKAIRLCGLPAFCILLTAVPALGQSDSMTDQLAAVENIVREAQRQEMVSRNMQDVIGDFQELVNDLGSNRLIDQGRADELTAMSGSVGAVNEKDVRPAAEHLRRAGQGVEERETHIDSADARIQAALADLTALLRRANAIRFEEFIVASLEQIIRDQETTVAGTKELGKDLLQGRDVDDQAAELAGAQKRVAQSVGDLGKTVKEASAEETTPQSQQKLVLAADLMEKLEIQNRLESAAVNIEARKPIAAVDQQEQALESLRRVERLLKADRDETLQKLIEARDQLESILDRQVKVRERTEDVPPQEFDRRAPELQVEQRDLQNRTGKVDKALEALRKAAPIDPAELAEMLSKMELEQAELRQQAEQAKPDAAQQNKLLAERQEELEKQADVLVPQMPYLNMQNRMEEARAAMEEAKQDLKKNEPEAAAEKQKTAEEALKDVREQAEQLASRQKEQNEAMKKAQKAMKEAGEALEKKEQKKTAEGQDKAQKDLDEAIKKLNEEIAQKEFDGITPQEAKELAEQREVADKLDELGQEQKELREQTEQKGEDQEDARPLKEPQKDLAEKAKELAEDLKEKPPEDQGPVDPLSEAEKKMEEAAKELEKDKPEDAAAKQKEAEKKLEEAREKAKQRQYEKERTAEDEKLIQLSKKVVNAIKRLIKEQELLNVETEVAAGEGRRLVPQAEKQRQIRQKLFPIIAEAPSLIDNPDVQQADLAMKEAAYELAKNAAGPGMEQQRRALNALRRILVKAKDDLEKRVEQKQMDTKGKDDKDADDKGKAKGKDEKGKDKGKDKKGGKTPKKGKGDKQDPKGKEPSDKKPKKDAKLSKRSNEFKNRDMRFTSSRFGDDYEKSESEKEILGKRERAALSENFARELPREYRELLKAYYETLSASTGRE